MTPSPPRPAGRPEPMRPVTEMIPRRRPRGWNLRAGMMVRPELEAHTQWKGDAARPESKRARLQRRLPLGPCEHCGKPGVDRHHKDGDTGHNTRDNIAILCRRCHMAEDGRLARFLAYASAPRELTPPHPCVICTRLYKPLRKGRCCACDQYLRVHGVERPNLRVLKSA